MLPNMAHSWLWTRVCARLRATSSRPSATCSTARRATQTLVHLSAVVSRRMTRVRHTQTRTGSRSQAHVRPYHGAMGNTASVVRRLCPINVAPDGVTCTFAYEIIGWVTIDDLDGISNESLVGGKYANFTEWCEASEDNIEFAGDVQTGEMEEGLDFWKNPRDEEANKERAANVVELYNDIVSGKFVSSMLYDVFVKKFKPLPTPEELAAQNPKCYESVKSCAGGCVRTGYSQLCTPCKAGEKGCEVADASFTFPSLEKARGNR